jgi:hypothetical protein
MEARRGERLHDDESAACPRDLPTICEMLAFSSTRALPIARPVGRRGNRAAGSRATIRRCHSHSSGGDRETAREIDGTLSIPRRTTNAIRRKPRAAPAPRECSVPRRICNDGSGVGCRPHERASDGRRRVLLAIALRDAKETDAKRACAQTQYADAAQSVRRLHVG